MQSNQLFKQLRQHNVNRNVSDRLLRYDDAMPPCRWLQLLVGAASLRRRRGRCGPATHVLRPLTVQCAVPELVYPAAIVTPGRPACQVTHAVPGFISMH